jgi:hypothetical protein
MPTMTLWRKYHCYGFIHADYNVKDATIFMIETSMKRWGPIIYMQVYLALNMKKIAKEPAEDIGGK